MKIVARIDRCVGAGQCVLTEPRVFDQSEEGTVRLLREHVEGDLLASVHEAVELCPSRALSIGEI